MRDTQLILQHHHLPPPPLDVVPAPFLPPPQLVHVLDVELELRRLVVSLNFGSQSEDGLGELCLVDQLQAVIF